MGKRAFHACLARSTVTPEGPPRFLQKSPIQRVAGDYFSPLKMIFNVFCFIFFIRANIYFILYSYLKTRRGRIYIYILYFHARGLSPKVRFAETTVEYLECTGGFSSRRLWASRTMIQSRMSERERQKQRGGGNLPFRWSLRNRREE